MAGALVIVGMIAGALSVVPVLEEPNFLALVPAQEGQVVVGALFQLVMIPAYVGFALCLYPTLRLESEALSLGFLGFRLVAGAFHVVGVVLLVLFLTLAQAGPADLPQLGVVGELLRTARDLVNHVALIISLGLGDLLLFVILYRSRLVPRWLSIWGLVGVGSAILASFLVLLRMTAVVAPAYLAMNAPLALHGLVLALWLLTRGLGTTASPGGRAGRRGRSGFETSDPPR